MRELAGAHGSVLVQANLLQDLLDGLLLLSVQSEEQAVPHALGPRQRKLHVLVYAMTCEHGRALKLATNAERCNLVLRELGEIARIVRHEYGATIRLGLAGDDVHQRSLACAVRADQAAQ